MHKVYKEEQSHFIFHAYHILLKCAVYLANSNGVEHGKLLYQNKSHSSGKVFD